VSKRCKRLISSVHSVDDSILLPGCGAAVVAALLSLAAPVGAAEADGLDLAFRSCVSLYRHPLAGDLMRSVSDSAARNGFTAAHASVVRSFSFEREHGYATATASLKSGVAIAGVPVRAIYASTCELECPLAVWGVEFGKLTATQRDSLQAWVESAPSTHTEAHGDIKVQLNTTSGGEALLVCDVSD
jgi:hypothetical protein